MDLCRSLILLKALAVLALLAATLDYDVDAEGYTDKGGGNCSTEKEEAALLQRHVHKPLNSTNVAPNIQAALSEVSRPRRRQWGKHETDYPTGYGQAGGSSASDELEAIEELKDAIETLNSNLAQIPAQVTEELTGALEKALPALGVQDVVIEQAPAGLCLGENASHVVPNGNCSELELMEKGNCTYTISNDPSRASANSTIIPGCGLLISGFQELFVYCNTASEQRQVTATTCNGLGTAKFNHLLAAFTEVSDQTDENSTRVACLSTACQDDSVGSWACPDAWTGEGEDVRVTVQFLVDPQACAYIIQQPSMGASGNDTDVLIITSRDPAATTTTSPASTTSTSQLSTTDIARDGASHSELPGKSNPSGDLAHLTELLESELASAKQEREQLHSEMREFRKIRQSLEDKTLLPTYEPGPHSGGEEVASLRPSTRSTPTRKKPVVARKPQDPLAFSLCRHDQRKPGLKRANKTNLLADAAQLATLP
ncbi:unnamed protein product [Symbiodinium natans]|uniref:MRH domain-containing protein n=1 Tax=Symbiodinium natans TaxID=878477 RepID=A0A812PS53_9DINO|nr:unnamed protein product [Symbiodinium natans]